MIISDLHQGDWIQYCRQAASPYWFSWAIPFLYLLFLAFIKIQISLEAFSSFSFLPARLFFFAIALNIFQNGFHWRVCWICCLQKLRLFMTFLHWTGQAPELQYKCWSADTIIDLNKHPSLKSDETSIKVIYKLGIPRDRSGFFYVSHNTVLKLIKGKKKREKEERTLPACLPSLLDILPKVHAHFLKKIVGSVLNIPIKGRNLQEALYKMPTSQREADTSLSSPSPTGRLHCFSAVFVSCMDVLDTDLSRTAPRISVTESAYRANA